METQEEIRRIAYEIWEKEGRPEGRDVEHYLRAEAMWREAQAQQNPASPAGGPKRRPTRRRKAARS
jgi:hypothetical protein